MIESSQETGVNMHFRERLFRNENYSLADWKSQKSLISFMSFSVVLILFAMDINENTISSDDAW